MDTKFRQSVYKLMRESYRTGNEFCASMQVQNGKLRVGQVIWGGKNSVMAPTDKKAIGTIHPHLYSALTLSQLDFTSAVAKNEQVTAVCGNLYATADNSPRPNKTPFRNIHIAFFILDPDKVAKYKTMIRENVRSWLNQHENPDEWLVFLSRLNLKIIIVPV
jgi:hypothetical protein